MEDLSRHGEPKVVTRSLEWRRGPFGLHVFEFGVELVQRHASSVIVAALDWRSICSPNSFKHDS